jgi:hypothetical protein
VIGGNLDQDDLDAIGVLPRLVRSRVSRPEEACAPLMLGPISLLTRRPTLASIRRKTIGRARGLAMSRVGGYGISTHPG